MFVTSLTTKKKVFLSIKNLRKKRKKFLICIFIVFKLSKEQNCKYKKNTMSQMLIAFRLKQDSCSRYKY